MPLKMVINIAKEYIEYSCSVLKKTFPLLFDHRIDLSKKINKKYKTVCIGRVVNVVRIVFLGQTGRGKSTTINSIIGGNVFQTDDIESCTNKVQSVLIRLNNSSFLSLCDLPGIGETEIKQREYEQWYRYMCYNSNVIVYVLNADQRDYRIDLDCFNRVIPNKAKQNVIIAVNKMEKLFPRDYDKNKIIGTVIVPKYIRQLSHVPSVNLYNKYRINLDEKITDIYKQFGIPPKRIIEYSALENIFTSYLNDLISKTLLSQCSSL